MGDPGYAALHTWIHEYVRDLPQSPQVLEVTNAEPWRMHIVPSAILQDDIYLQLSEEQKVHTLPDSSIDCHEKKLRVTQHQSHSASTNPVKCLRMTKISAANLSAQCGGEQQARQLPDVHCAFRPCSAVYLTVPLPLAAMPTVVEVLAVKKPVACYSPEMYAASAR